MLGSNESPDASVPSPTAALPTVAIVDRSNRNLMIVSINHTFTLDNNTHSASYRVHLLDASTGSESNKRAIGWVKPLEGENFTADYSIPSEESAALGSYISVDVINATSEYADFLFTYRGDGSVMITLEFIDLQVPTYQPARAILTELAATPTLVATPTLPPVRIDATQAPDPSTIDNAIEKALLGTVQILTGARFGSGFIVNESGLIVTTAQVVEDHHQIQIRLSNDLNEGFTCRGESTGIHPSLNLGEVTETYPSLNLAYIQIDSNCKFTPLAIGNSEEIHVGDSVIAIGFISGATLGPSFPVSGFPRPDANVFTGSLSAKLDDSYLQTDMQYNNYLEQGKSGGPLLNAHGYVIGVIDVAGFILAIPINQVKNHLGQ